MELTNVDYENDLTLLTDIARETYSHYLVKTLTENFNSYCTNLGLKQTKPPVDWLKKCSAMYENDALQSCMVLEFYRKRILEIICDIRNNTSCGKLADKLKLYSSENDLNLLNNFSVNASTQTDCIAINQVQKNIIDTNFSSLINKHNINNSNALGEQKIIFESINLCSPVKKKSKMSNLNCSSSTVSHCTEKEESDNAVDEIIKELDDLISANAEANADDEIELALDEMFKETTEIDEFDQLFGYDNNAEESKDILKEIEDLAKLIRDGNEIKFVSDNKDLVATNEKLLKESIWPCELHMRKQKLCTVLSQADDVLLMERIKNKFTDLFGIEGAEDDFKWYSPTLEFNDILLSSCSKRIAPWIVKHLMQPLNDGLISNRYLFKKLAKHLAHQIIIENQYPDECYVFARIQDFFCFHKRVDTVEDIT